MVTVSPGSASTSGITHETCPSAASISSTVIEPSRSEICFVSSLPFVSEMNASDHVTGYTPGFVGAV